MTILVRSDAGTDALSGIRKEIAFIDPNLNIFNVQTLSAYLDRSQASLRFSIETWGGIGVFGLLLAAIGLAGVTAYSVAQRRKEIAIRMAIGASRGQVLWLVLREGVALVSVGTALGFLGAIALAKILSALANIFVDALKVGTNDPRLLVGVPLLLAVVAMLACYVPARRSAQIDPLKALREE
jgi:putative ABC transport system permease protein